MHSRQARRALATPSRWPSRRRRRSRPRSRARAMPRRWHAPSWQHRSRRRLALRRWRSQSRGSSSERPRRMRRPRGSSAGRRQRLRRFPSCGRRSSNSSSSSSSSARRDRHGSAVRRCPDAQYRPGRRALSVFTTPVAAALKGAQDRPSRQAHSVPLQSAGEILVRRTACSALRPSSWRSRTVAVTLTSHARAGSAAAVGRCEIAAR